MAPAFHRHRLVLLGKCKNSSEIAYPMKVKNMLTEDVNAMKTRSRYTSWRRKGTSKAAKPFPASPLHIDHSGP
jgi:hypothetical protein